MSERGKDGVAEVVMSSQEVVEMMEEFVKWLGREVPGVELRTVDFLPRDSVGGRFAMAARNWSSRVVQIGPDHHHICLWRIFVTESRSWKVQTAKGNRKTAPWMEKSAQEGLPTSPVRFELRRFLYGYDGVHLSAIGRRILTDILLWQTTAAPGQSRDIQVKVDEDGEGSGFKCRAFFKF